MRTQHIQCIALLSADAILVKVDGREANTFVLSHDQAVMSVHKVEGRRKSRNITECKNKSALGKAKLESPIASPVENRATCGGAQAHQI